MQWLLSNRWLRPPSLVVSIIGHDVDTATQELVANVMSRGLIKGALKTDAVVIDDGASDGLSQVPLGEVI